MYPAAYSTETDTIADIPRRLEILAPGNFGRF